MPKLRELRYVRRNVGDLDAESHFAGDAFGLMAEDSSDTEALFRADGRFYSLCLSTQLQAAVGFSVAVQSDVAEFAQAFDAAGFKVDTLDGEDATRRGIKQGIAIAAPNGVQLEIVWRHLQSGQPYHGPRNTGLMGFTAVQMASTDPAADREFWQLAGLDVSDFAGASTFLSLDSNHHQIALYQSDHNGLLGAVWQVETVDNVMRHWHVLLNRQVAIAHGPGRQPTSGARFVTAKAPDGFLMTYATEMDAPPKGGPRQFSDAASSHCSWGSPSDLAEFKGEAV
jgi:2,3-dihydroxy-p-cumate/2,3-dihydroxybenzoate 3,4-dioxygenase